MAHVSDTGIHPRARSSWIRAAVVAVAASAALSPAAAHAGGGAGPSYLVMLSVTGPGEMTTDPYGFFVRNEGTFPWSGAPVMLTLTAHPYGNNAVFAGWQGDCAHEGTNPTCTLIGPASTGPARAESGQQVAATPVECRWVGAAFKDADAPTPTMKNACVTETPGGGGSGGGGTNPGGGSSAPGGGSGAGGSGGEATPKPGTVLAGGVTTVRKAPPLQRTRVSVLGKRIGTTGTAPTGTTRVVQSLALIGNASVNVAGRCRLVRASGAFRCGAPATRGRWAVITQAKRGSAVIAQTTRTVRVR